MAKKKLKSKKIRGRPPKEYEIVSVSFEGELSSEVIKQAARIIVDAYKNRDSSLNEEA